MGRKKRTSGISKYALLVLGIILGAALVMLYNQYQAGTGAGAGPQIATMPDSAKTASAKIAAVTGEGGSGIVGEVTIELIPGSGRVLITTQPFAEFDTQRSVEIAKSAAEKITGMSLDKYDILAAFKLTVGNEQPEVVGGPSAGVSLATAIIAAAEQLNVRKDVVMTGSVDAGGNVGRVGGVFEKAKAAAGAGAKIFIVPEGSGEILSYTKQVRRRVAGGFSVEIVDYVPQRSSLTDYARQLGIEAYEVSHISEVLPLAIENWENEKGRVGLRVVAGAVESAPVQSESTMPRSLPIGGECEAA